MQIVRLGQAGEDQLRAYPGKFPIYLRQGFEFTRKYLLHATCTL